jgi:hypothetical protein
MIAAGLAVIGTGTSRPRFLLTAAVIMFLEAVSPFLEYQYCRLRSRFLLVVALCYSRDSCAFERKRQILRSNESMVGKTRTGRQRPDQKPSKTAF